MKIHQLSLFLENRAGQSRQPIKVLAEAGLSIKTLMLADTEQFGIMRMIVDDWQKARKVLEEAGCVVKVNEVLALEVPDRPGGLEDLLSKLDDAKLNIEYMYAFTFGREDHAVMIFRFDDVDGALAALTERGVKMASAIDIYERNKA